MGSKMLKIFLVTTAIVVISGCGGNTNKVQSQPSSSPLATPSPVIERANPAYTPSSEIKSVNGSKETATVKEESKSVAPNTFVPEKVKKGDKVGAFAVTDIKKDKEFITVRFGGKVKVSGSYNSDHHNVYGEFITLNPDENSKSKIPAVIGSQSWDFVLDPQYQKDVDFTKLFGKIGTIGKFEIELNEFLITDWTGALKRVGKLGKVVKIEDNKKK